MAGFWNRVLELSAPIIGQPTVDALQKNLDVSRNISRLRATLPRARLLIERSESWGFIYRPIDDLLPLLKEAIDKADHELGEFETQRQRLEGSNWNIQGELVNNFKNWISGFPDNVKSANDMLDHVCNEMENICSMLDIPNSPNQFSEHISWLHAVLPRARLLVERSECWRFRFDTIKELHPQLKEAVYKAEIELDDIESKKRILEGANWRIEDEFLNYLGNWISGSQDKVKSTRVMLDYACNEMEKLCENYKIPENPNEFSNTARPITFSSHPKIYGRDKELDEAINSLGVPRSAGSSGTKRKKIEKLAILPIVGMGGMGKTTLAQMIYRDKCVQSYFDLRIWICVSDKFDIGRLMKEIIECATGKECNITNLNKIEEILEEILKFKRVFLVLDDIWSKDWHRILRPLNEVSEGSVVVLTTRSPEHLQCTENSVTILKSISLEGLEEKIYWDFFRSCAGLVVASENYGELEGIAREICSKLKGIPLAAITLGSLLSKRIDRNHWIKIRDSKMWELKQEEEYHIMPVLRLSYQYLPSHLKKCFSFCSLYPKDHEFTAIALAKFWIMEGLIPIKENLKEMEDLALDYFYELQNSCFFHFKGRSRIPKEYVMHDLMHDVCLSITADECYCLEEENFEKISDGVHHMSVFLEKLDPESPKKMGKFKKLHSLMVYPYCGIRGIRAIKSWCDELTSLRRLALSKYPIRKLPENIGNLKHLQYLDISGTQIQNLPNSFCILYNLQHLDMGGCDNFSESHGFPDGSNKLTGLRFFRPPLHMVRFLTNMPNLSSAMQLCNLSYNVNSGTKIIENIKHIRGIRGFLDIRELRNVSRKEAAEEAELNKQEHLHTLRLYWQDDVRYVIFPDPESKDIHKEVLEGLCPHANLAVLEIYNYYGQSLPSWMGDALPNLRRVMFKYCFNYTISQLPCSITELVIVACHRLTSLQDCLQPSLLPKLKCIEIRNCEELVLLPVESFCEFMSLEKLVVRFCLKLTCPKMMVLPPSLKLLHLETCDQLGKSIPSCLQNLTFLEDFRLVFLPHIISISSEVMWNLKSLKRLHISSCPNLESLGDEEFLQSIKDCSIELCPKRKITWGRNPDGGQLSGALAAAAPSSSHIIPSVPPDIGR